MALREDTRDLHHVCEQHPIGASMSRGWGADRPE